MTRVTLYGVVARAIVNGIQKQPALRAGAIDLVIIVEQKDDLFA
jgi:hypothetical protein